MFSFNGWSAFSRAGIAPFTLSRCSLGVCFELSIITASLKKLAALLMYSSFLHDKMRDQIRACSLGELSGLHTGSMEIYWKLLLPQLHRQCDRWSFSSFYRLCAQFVRRQYSMWRSQYNHRTCFRLRIECFWHNIAFLYLFRSAGWAFGAKYCHISIKIRRSKCR